MRHHRMALAVAVALPVALAGCGSATSSAAPGLAAPAETGRPTWGGCHQHSQRFVDGAAGVAGARSLDAALAPYREDGDHVVQRSGGPHRNASWLLVDDANVIRSAVEVAHTEQGWLVMSVASCAH